jgi:TolB protein
MRYKPLTLIAVTVVALATSVAVAADRQHGGDLVYAAIRGGDAEIVLRDRGGEIRALTNDDASDEVPALSPDGKLVAFSSNRDGDYDLYVMKIDGTEVEQLTDATGDESYPAWSPDGKRLAFTQTRQREEAEIYLINADGTGRTRLTRTKRHVIDTQPAFSADGRYVAFSSNRLAYSNSEIYRLRLADRQLKRLTFHGSGKDGAPGTDVLPEFSPNGEVIAFVSDRSGSHQIHVMDLSGKKVRQVTRIAGRDVTFPRFSQDGKHLTYMTVAVKGGKTRVVTARADGAGAQVVGLGEAPNW